MSRRNDALALLILCAAGSIIVTAQQNTSAPVAEEVLLVFGDR
jgi:hypothetical protein